MAKQSGLGDHFMIGGYLIGGDVSDVAVHGGPALLDVTDITQSAHSRLGGLRDGGMDITTINDPAAGAEHAALSGLTRGDLIATYLRGQAIGSPAASCVAKEVTYDGTRANDGMLTFKTTADPNAFGVEWGLQLTPGARTDTGATNGTSLDTLASLSFGGQAYLQAVAFTGTDATVVIQDSADNATFTAVTGLSFTQITGGTPLAQRISITNTSTIRRYVRVATITTGGFTSLQFAVALTKNAVGGVVF